jgi:hypothetical protein
VADISDEIRRYSKGVGYIAHHHAQPACRCGNQVFRLRLDDAQGAAVRECVACAAEHPIGDSHEFLGDADLEQCACPCGGEKFEIAVAVSLYDDSEDVKWLYLGCRCPTCGLTAVYGDWKNEYVGYRELLARV